MQIEGWAEAMSAVRLLCAGKQLKSSRKRHEGEQHCATAGRDVAIADGREFGESNPTISCDPGQKHQDEQSDRKRGLIGHRPIMRP